MSEKMRGEPKNVVASFFLVATGVTHEKGCTGTLYSSPCRCRQLEARAFSCSRVSWRLGWGHRGDFGLEISAKGLHYSWQCIRSQMLITSSRNSVAVDTEELHMHDAHQEAGFPIPWGSRPMVELDKRALKFCQNYVLERTNFLISV